jgi:subtilisin family serine protease
VDWLVAQGVDVISYSCGWIGAFPFDGSGLPHNPVSAAVSDARTAGVLWVNSAGNYAEGDTYSATYVQLPGYTWHSFDGDWANGFFLWANQGVSLALTWNDWPADPQTQGSTQDYDMELWRWDGAAWVVDVSSANPQSGAPGQVPCEEIDFTSPMDSWYYLVINKVSATSDHDLNLRSFGPGFLHSQPERSVAVPAESPDALAVGAAFWSDLGLEPFSSRGPTLGPGGTLTGGALKPDLAGADGTSGATYGMSNGVPWPNGTGFFGTSAACPHVAGGAALLLSRMPALHADLLETTLLWGGEDLGDPGADIGFGHGLMRLDSVLFADGFESGGTTAWSNAMP